MKRMYRFIGVFLCIYLFCATILPVAATPVKTSSYINTAVSSNGYFTVCYDEDVAVKMKVGVTFNGKTTYYNYTHGETSAYTFTEGNGKYTIALFRNVRGTSYATVDYTTVTVDMKSVFAPYLVSTDEIMFTDGDNVSKMAADLCDKLTDDASRVTAIHNFISQNFKYDYDFAARVSSGAIKTYVPDTNTVLADKNGICYDFSALFAAMCRSQGIPCKLQKGYYNGVYHAWNLVYVNGVWQSVDTTLSIGKKIHAASFADCLINETNISNYRV